MTKNLQDALETLALCGFEKMLHQSQKSRYLQRKIKLKDCAMSGAKACSASAYSPRVGFVSAIPC